MYDKNTKLA